MSDIYFQQPDGRWFLYSTVTDEFILEDVSREEVLEYKLEEYRQSMEQRLDEIEERGGDWYNPTVSYEDLVYSHRVHHGPTQECLECGEDIPTAIDDYCPACGTELSEGDSEDGP